MKHWGAIAGLAFTVALLAWTSLASAMLVFFLGVWDDVSWPAKVVGWWLYVAHDFGDPRVNAHVAWWCLVTAVIASALPLLVAKLVLDMCMRRKAKLHGESAFASRAEIERGSVFSIRRRRQL